jgi:8-amino-7-oxononanoate synthase
LSRQDLAAALAARDAAGLFRRRETLLGCQGTQVKTAHGPLLSFASNDYLGLAAHPGLRAALVEGIERHGVGAGASPVAGGHFEAQATFEAKAAAFVGMPRALSFESGYMANLAILSALAGRHDTIYADKLNHACLNDGALLSRARLRRYRHADAGHLESLLAGHAGGQAIIATDAVFSMDGDIAPLARLIALAVRYDAWLVVDDAHGFGVLGESGRGALWAHRPLPPQVIYMATLGKAAGVMGAFVAAETSTIEWMLQTARPYLYATASPPALAVALGVALDLIASAGEGRARLARHAQQLAAGLPPVFRRLPSSTPIQPLVVGDNRAVLALAEALREQGIWVPAIRPPTVPEGSARLRVSLSAAHREEDVQRLVAALEYAAGSAHGLLQ